MHQNKSISVGDFVEVTDGWHEHLGMTGTIEAIQGSIATVQPVDELMVPCGLPIETHVGRLTKQPTPTELRRLKTHYRAKHLKEKRAQSPAATYTPSIREVSALMFFPHRGWDT